MHAEDNKSLISILSNVWMSHHFRTNMCYMDCSVLFFTPCTALTQGLFSCWKTLKPQVQVDLGVPGVHRIHPYHLRGVCKPARNHRKSIASAQAERKVLKTPETACARAHSIIILQHIAINRSIRTHPPLSDLQMSLFPHSAIMCV